MDTRIIHTRFWTDDYVCSLEDKEVMFFFYLLTNERVNLIGMYEIPDSYIIAAIRTTKDQLKKMKEKFQQDGKFIFFKSWVRIVNHEKYQQYKGEKNDVAKERLLSFVPIELKEYRIDTVSIPYLVGADTTKNPKPEIQNKKYELDDPLIIAELVDNFPNIDVPAEIEKMKDWLLASGKTKKNYKAFARIWLRRCNPSPPTKYVDNNDLNQLRLKTEKYVSARN